MWPPLRHAVLSLAGRMPRRPPRSLVRVFYGHRLDARDVPAFRNNLRMLRDHFEFIGLSEAVALCRGADPPDGRFAAFTFDDGFADNFENVAPALDEFGARAAFFVSTNFIESDDAYRLSFLKDRVHAPTSLRPMTWDQLRTLSAAGFEVGAHTLDHVRLSDVPVVEAVRQVVASKRAVESALGKPCDYFSWPYGYPRDMSDALLPTLAREFRAVFSAMRSRTPFSYGGAVINRDHFEPSWPEAHVRYFALRARRVDTPDRKPL